jgi:hypothetical protein
MNFIGHFLINNPAAPEGKIILKTGANIMRMANIFQKINGMENEA